MLAGKKILIGITGSIAAYKTLLIVRSLIKQRAEVKVIMTAAAKDFVSPLVLSTFSKNEVLTDLFFENSWANHVMLGRWADVLLIAPLSCNTLSKMAAAQCDNLLLSVYLSAACPVIVAPAMDEDMWIHRATKKNIETIKSYGNYVINVEKGELASGLNGEGRMAEPEKIVEYLTDFFSRNNLFKNKKILITAGPTQEAIDPVRFIANHSSGKMGFALAESFAEAGAEVILVTGKTSLEISKNSVKTIHVTSADEMYEACIAEFPSAQIAVLSAAVADYKPVSYASEKIKKSGDEMILHLTKTKDILKSLGEIKKSDQLLVGFALETNNEKENALKKLKNKNADFIVLNSMRDENATFGFDTNKITVFDKEGNEFNSPLQSKKDIADFIINIISQKIV